jgi:hypothetical protein
MFYTPANSFNQVKSGKRLNKKSPPDSLPIVYPILISKDNADARMRVRHEQRLDAYTLVCLLHFVKVTTQRVSELMEMTPLQAAYVSIRPNNGKPRIGADLRAVYRLQRLRQHHLRSLSQHAANTITEALCWYNDLCQEMRERRESVPLSAFL